MLQPLLLSLALLPLLAEAGDRAFKVKNECTFTVWPAISNYPTDISTIYTGTKAWEAAAGTEQDITMYADSRERRRRRRMKLTSSSHSPAGWNGRIWARLGCTKSGENHLSCKFGGDDASAWEPADNGMGNVSSAPRLGAQRTKRADFSLCHRRICSRSTSRETWTGGM
jgi:hypothetical protein